MISEIEIEFSRCVGDNRVFGDNSESKCPTDTDGKLLITLEPFKPHGDTIGVADTEHLI